MINEDDIKIDELSNIKTPITFYVIFTIIIFLMIMMFVIFFYNKPKKDTLDNKTETEIAKNVLLTFFFFITVISLCYIMLPKTNSIQKTLSSLFKLFEDIKSVSYAVIYTISLILFFGFVPESTVNTYSKIILIVSFILGVFVFYKAGSYSYINEFNVNYERIKTIILFYCLLTVFIIFYNNDPGGFLSKYFGTAFILMSLVGLFSILYLIVVVTLPDKPNIKPSTDILSAKFTRFSKYVISLLFLFIVVVFVLVFRYNNDKSVFRNRSVAAGFLIFAFCIALLWTFLVGANTFPESLDKSLATNQLSLFKRALLTLFSLIVSGLLIAWIAITIENYGESGKSNLTKFILNFAIIAIILGLIYKTINVDLPVGNNKKNSFVNLILTTVFYVPCLFTGIFDIFASILGRFFNIKVGSPKVGSVDLSSLLMFLFACGFILLYVFMPSIFNIVNKQGGNQLLDQPVNTNTSYALGTFQELNKRDDFDYQYAISFWVFINSIGPNMNPNYNRYASLLNFGEKPNILYNGSINTLLVTMDMDGELPSNSDETYKNKLVEFDENGNRILYRNEKFLLQKWNNIIINYSAGTLDIFLNGELVKSIVGIVPYYKLDSLTIGETNGIEGGICNVIYFRKNLNIDNIFYLYNMVKDKNPPVFSDTSDLKLVKAYNTVAKNEGKGKKYSTEYSKELEEYSKEVEEVVLK
jgi:hypothetical protein